MVLKWYTGMITYLQLVRLSIYRKRQINKLKKLKQQKLEEVNYV
jgi:hypothetical protein